jgi:tRNA1Val (adenine37-N6)-methyltransferase
MDEVALKEDETLDELFSGRLKIIQKASGYRVSMDPILLAHFASPLKGGGVIDLGTGNGVIPMILALRGDAGELVGVEIQEELVDMANRGLILNGLQDRVRIVRADFRYIQHWFPPQSFDHVICNPPYHPLGRGRPSPLRERGAARHEVEGTIEDVVASAGYLLGTKGRLWLTYPTVRLPSLFQLLRGNNLEPKGLRMVHGRVELPARMALIEAAKGAKEGLHVHPPLILYVQGRQYTEELQEIYRMI